MWARLSLVSGFRNSSCLDRIQTKGGSMPRSQSTFQKRQKEQQRQQKQRDKAERRLQKKSAKPEQQLDEMEELRRNAEAQAALFNVE